jgi:transcription elongation factor Elf1
MEKVTDQVSFKCRQCRDSLLVSKGACLTEKGNIYFVFYCSGCEAQINIGLTETVTELYQGKLAPGSNMVN